MSEFKNYREQYECPICASDIEPEYIEMCRSELNKIKAEAVREAVNSTMDVDKRILRAALIELANDLENIGYEIPDN